MKNLKKLQTSRHLSQFKLAKLFHISRQSIWKYGNDLVQPDLELITASANYFNAPIDYLVGDMNSPRKYETLSETKLGKEELVCLRSYHISAPEIRRLSGQMMQLYFDMQNGSEKE